MNNNSRKSVTASPSPSKASKKQEERKSRQESYKGKFSRPHMIIPELDSEFIETQKPSVIKLWLQCWRCDPYGSRWQVLNHSLKPSSFSAGKKILYEAGLFTFKSERSIRDGRETICWLVMNLHGSRRNDYWLESTKIESNFMDGKSTELDSKSTKMAIESTKLDSISDQTQSQQAFQNPSETSQEHLSNSSKELLKVLPVDPWEDDRDQKLALEGQLSSASSPNEKEENKSSLLTKSNKQIKQKSQTYRQSSKPLNKKSTHTKEELCAMSVENLLEINFESWNLQQLEMLPLFENKGNEFTNDTPKAERERARINFQLRTEYINRRSRAITNRQNEETKPKADRSSSQLFLAAKAYTAKRKNIKKADRESRLKGDSPW